MKKIWSDRSKFDKWLKVDKAACEAWAELGMIPVKDMARIRKATFKLSRIDEILSVTHHDMTAFLGAVSESLGKESRFIHMGLTSSDVMDTALSMQLAEASKLLISSVEELIVVLEEKAILYKHQMMMGRTHGVHAEPTTFGLKLALWAQEMRRNLYRLKEAENVISYGKLSGAVGTYATIPPEIEEKACLRLKLIPAPLSSQILQRDRHAQFVTTLAIIAGSLEKCATEIRSLQRTEVLEAEEPFSAGQTGSSAMPHKRNPELCERVCGLARLIRGHSVTALENISLWHERDISHSSAERIILPDACMALDYSLHIFTSVMKGLQIYPDNMKRNVELTQQLVFSQRVLLALVNKGLKRQDAYKLVQRNAMKAWGEKRNFQDLVKADKDIMAHLTDREITNIFNYEYFLRYVDAIFARLGLLKKSKGSRKTVAARGLHK
jgi:adenylosuccinate lyase